MITQQSIQIQNIRPIVDDGSYPIKRVVGDVLTVTADILKEGHDVLAAALKYRARPDKGWHEVRMHHDGNDLWSARVTLTDNTRYFYTIEAWTDSFATWQENIVRSASTGQDVSVELTEGRTLVAAALAATRDMNARHALTIILHDFDSAVSIERQREVLCNAALRRLMDDFAARADVSLYPKELEVVVDRPSARFAAWYEMFHRSQGCSTTVSATFRDCEARLPEIAAMGFDVLYLVPIHPIGLTHRKGPNNSPVAGPNAPGSPYAIGNRDGGHTAIHPDLGTLEDFRRFLTRATTFGMEIALDIALQCSPDHPYLTQHPEWFRYRPDGSIRYAENPPKVYQDIVNVDFLGDHREAIWQEWRDVFLFWIGQGVKLFRIDNPHTKPIPFWEWLIRDIQLTHPDVLFLAEAFTRPKLLRALAKAGFSQSYTYFTWRNFKQELTDYLTALVQGDESEYLRPNLFTNTPDILPEFLQAGGRPAFQIRLVLAATLSSLYGIYNGFELCEARALPDSEEYLDSEKYQYKVWDWDRPGNIKDYIAKVNHIRREHSALQHWTNLRFHAADSDHVLFYSKRGPEAGDVIFVAVNLDPFEAHQATLSFPLDELGIPQDKNFQVEEQLNGRKHFWRGVHHRVTLDPQHNPALIFKISPWTYRDYVDTCF